MDDRWQNRYDEQIDKIDKDKILTCFVVVSPDKLDYDQKIRA